jgi:hypothetical protein
MSYIAGALGISVATVFYVINLRTSIENRKVQLLRELTRVYPPRSG